RAEPAHRRLPARHRHVRARPGGAGAHGPARRGGTGTRRTARADRGGVPSRGTGRPRGRLRGPDGERALAAAVHRDRATGAGALHQLGQGAAGIPAGGQAAGGAAGRAFHGPDAAHDHRPFPVRRRAGPGPPPRLGRGRQRARGRGRVHRGAGARHQRRGSRRDQHRRPAGPVQRDGAAQAGAGDHGSGRGGVAPSWLVRRPVFATAKGRVNPEMALTEARQSRQQIEPFTDADPDLGMADGYAVQQELVKLLLADGDRIVGYKVGLTSKPMQKMIGVDTPDYGPVLGSTVYADGDAVPVSAFIQPKIEAEIAFVLGSPLAGPGVSVLDARRAIAGMTAAVEIVDSRFADWRIKLADTVADLASNGAVAISSRVVSLDGVDPRLIGMVLTRQG